MDKIDIKIEQNRSQSFNINIMSRQYANLSAAEIISFLRGEQKRYQDIADEINKKIVKFETQNNVKK